VRTRQALLPGIAVTLLVLVALLLAGLQPQMVRTAAAHAPDQLTIAVLRPGKSVCEGPLVSRGPARSVGIWGAASRGPAHLTVTVREATTHAMLATGSLEAPAAEAEQTSRLARAVPGGRPLQVCLTDNVNNFSLVGSAVSAPSVVSTGLTSGQRFALVLLSDGSHSLLSSLSTAFSRASLWRPSWVGSWTFWALTIMLLASFGAALVAVASAASADDRPDGWTSPPPPDGGPPSPAGDLGPGENRPAAGPLKSSAADPLREGHGQVST
jgi:hypothetical protein